MIYCNLKGGLGNMLFQLAGAKSIAIDNNTDCSFPNLIQHLQYLNDDNQYNPSLKHSFDYLKIFDNLNDSPIALGSELITFPYEYVKVTCTKPNTIVDGFFQSEKYFVHNRQAILDMFIFDFNLNGKYDILNDKRTTAIHVRRGDYVNHPNHHPTQDLEYYLKGVDMLKDETDLFVVFSDDIEWCKEHIKPTNVIYIEDEKDYIELYLMSICNNNIVSNSSFSWWGAWLNKNEDKKVIGPLKWFGAAITHNTDDVLPNNWIKI